MVQILPLPAFPTALLSVLVPKCAQFFALKTRKTGPGAVSLTIPKPVFAYFSVFQAISAPKTRKLPDLSGRQIRQFIWQGMRDSNPRKRSQSPVCYRYTNPLYMQHRSACIIICICAKMSRVFFLFLQKLNCGLKPRPQHVFPCTPLFSVCVRLWPRKQERGRKRAGNRAEYC